VVPHRRHPGVPSRNSILVPLASLRVAWEFIRAGRENRLLPVTIALALASASPELAGSPDAAFTIHRAIVADAPEIGGGERRYRRLSERGKDQEEATAERAFEDAIEQARRPFGG
jgi:predicted lysophospholipase L1 biosynthesis ABC-type transport system permease subunit